MPDQTLPNGKTIHQLNGRWYTQEMLELSNLILPDCPITFEIRYGDCVPALHLTQREHLVGTRHYDCDGTTDEFLAWAETRHGKIAIGEVASQHHEFFINTAGGGMVEITAGEIEKERA